ncbi:MAG: hypothetical protein NT051_01125 [Candidatus Micrarchaeota archaeon]|nr:hypothetical protein [Candidatus Micrarchaeota archaeon]
MAEEKKKKDKEGMVLKSTGEQRLHEIVTELDSQLRKEMGTRPYLITVTTGYEIGKDGGKSVLAAQWSWRSNVIVEGTDSETLIGFLTGQLKDAVENPENGIKKKYARKK